jgi:LysR family transcriptional regulator, hca operon transcriptional activator
MDLRYLRYFVAVAEEMNFTHAAERLHTVQPSLSRQIQRLEEIVGTPLFKRDRHGLKLTEAGRIFLDESRSILKQMDHAITLARQGARAEAGHISMGFIAGTEMRILSKFLPTLKQRYPEMQSSFQALVETELLEGLEQGKVNVAFLTGPIFGPNIVSEPVFRQRLVVVLPASHPLAKMRRIPLDRLASMTWIRPSNKDSHFVSSLIEIAERAGVHFKSFIEHDNVLSALHAVGLGMGFALIPDYQREFVPSSIITRPLDLEPQPTLELHMAYRKDDRTPAMAFFLGIVRECMGKDQSPVHSAEPLAAK